MAIFAELRCFPGLAPFILDSVGSGIRLVTVMN